MAVPETTRTPRPVTGRRVRLEVGRGGSWYCPSPPARSGPHARQLAWAHLEPRPGEYDFTWLDEVMDLLHEHGINVNLATATASPPPWLSLKLPGL
ncbi:hypothetical protein CTI14_52725, partial [Methylobacterium radiotolerans]